METPSIIQQDTLPVLAPPFFVPTYCGAVYGLNLGCFGWVKSSDTKLVICYLYGAVTAVQAIYAKLISDNSVYLSVGTGNDYYSREWGNADKAGYQKIPKSPKQVEGTESVSLVIVSNTLLDWHKDSMYCHVPDTGDMRELHYRLIYLLRKMSPVPVLDEWGEKLWQIGLDNKLISLLESKKRNTLKGIYNDINQYGFRIYEIRNDAGMWEKVIQNSLKNSELEISQNGSTVEEKKGERYKVQYPDGREGTIDELLESDEVKNMSWEAQAAMRDAIAIFTYEDNDDEQEEEYG